MPIVLQMTRKLALRPTPPELSGIRLRHYAGPQDIETWLDIRRRAFARQKVGISDWDSSDFHREFLSKPWWRPEVMWLAETEPLLMPTSAVGTVTLARRGDKPVVHWLCVAPGNRRQGVGRLLLTTLEAAAWDIDERQIWLETHTAWSEALRLYESLGYRPVEG
ncbi:MAG: GNAT family N-acetyltransferase [Pirellulales bacterium]